MERRLRKFGVEGKGGFTLVEILVGASLSMLLMAAILAAVFQLSKTGVAMGNYHDLEEQSRKVLQHFARDVHQAEGAAWESAQKLHLTLEEGIVTYHYSAQQRSLTRTEAGKSGVVLATGIADLTARAYDVNGSEVHLNSANAGANTKMIQFEMKLERRAGGAKNVTPVISSRYMMRNKKNQ